MEYVKTCYLCGKQFVTTRYQQQLCVLPHPKICKICGDTFYVRGINKDDFYCSKECKLKDIPYKTCVICGKEFKPKHKNQILCDDKHVRTCPVCGKEFDVLIGNLDKVCCSQKCRGVYERNNGAFKKASLKAKQTCLDKYGVDSYSKTDEFIEREKKTCLEKYGTEFAIQNDDVKDKRVQTVRKRYGVDNVSQIEELKHDRYEKAKETSIERYGVEHPWMLKEIREKSNKTKLERYGTIHPSQNSDIQDKVKKTSMERYGADNVRKSEYGKIRIKETCRERYGVDNPFQSEDIKEKIRRTNIERYGVPYITQNEDIRKKIVATNIERYGTSYYTQTDEFKSKFLDSMKATCLERYGVEWPCLSPNTISSHNQISKINRSFMSMLKELGIDAIYEKHIGGKSYDIGICNSNIVIELDPSCTHNVEWNPFSTVGIDKNYHLMKTNIAEEHGYRCIHVWDWDSWDKIAAILKPKKTIYARCCDIHVIDKDIAYKFNNIYHLQGNCRGQNICYGIYYYEELVGVVTFGVPRYNHNYEYELLRLCYRPDIVIVGGSVRLFQYFIRHNNPISVISYCDKSKFNGYVYVNMGMKLLSGGQPTKHWWSGKKSESMNHITDNLLRQKGFDNIFGTSYGKGTSNEELMLDRGYLPVYDCGQMTFIWEAERK